jgi:hypothetical protein
MGYLTDKISTAIYNGAVKRRNKFVRGDYHVKDKGAKFARASGSYLNAVGTNIVNDVSTGQSQMFPFKNPHEQQHTKHKVKPKTREVHHHHYYEGPSQPKRKKRKQSTYRDPYPLI